MNIKKIIKDVTRKDVQGRKDIVTDDHLKELLKCNKVFREDGVEITISQEQKIIVPYFREHQTYIRSNTGKYLALKIDRSDIRKPGDLADRYRMCTIQLHVADEKPTTKIEPEDNDIEKIHLSSRSIKAAVNFVVPIDRVKMTEADIENRVTARNLLIDALKYIRDYYPYVKDNGDIINQVDNLKKLMRQRDEYLHELIEARKKISGLEKVNKLMLERVDPATQLDKWTFESWIEDEMHITTGLCKSNTFIAAINCHRDSIVADSIRPDGYPSYIWWNDDIDHKGKTKGRRPATTAEVVKFIEIVGDQLKQSQFMSIEYDLQQKAWIAYSNDLKDIDEIKPKDE